MSGIVQNLILGPGLVGSLLIFPNPVHHPAVGSLRNLPLKLQFEILILFPCHNVSSTPLCMTSQTFLIHGPSLGGEPAAPV